MTSKKLIRMTQSRIFVLLSIYVFVVLFFTVKSNGQYLEWTSIRFIFSSMAVETLLTCGAVFLVITGNIDLSTVQIAALSGVVVAKFLSFGLPWPLAVICTSAVAGFIGAVSASLILKIKMPPFIATLAVYEIVRGALMRITHGGRIDISNEFILWFGTYKIGGEVPVNLIFTFAVYALYGIVLAKTKFGRSTYFVGGNPAAARLSGLNPSRIIYAVFINNAILCSLAGMLQAARFGIGTMSGVSGGMFTGLTGAILGGAAFGGGTGGLAGAFAALILLNGLNVGLLILGVPGFWQSLTSGVLLLSALSIDFFNKRWKK